MKIRDHQVFQFVIWRSYGGCDVGELADSRVLFLREQVRDLRLQEFLSELIVGVTAPNDLAWSIIVKILQCGEGEDVEQVARTSKQFSCICDCSSLSLNSLVFNTLHDSYCSFLYMLDNYLCLIVIYAWDCLLSCMLLFLRHSLHAWYCAHTRIQPREV